MPIVVEIQQPAATSNKFQGGDLIQGAVIITNNSGKSKLLSQALTITFTGKANSSWKEMRKNVSHVRQYLSTVYDEEIYFNESVTLQSPDSSIHNREILPGKTEYAFTFQLPMGLPESYQSEQGTVVYFAEVLYSRSWKPDKTIRAEFPVQGYLDLNCSPEIYCRPSQFGMEKKFWFGFGKVGAILYLPRRGFAPGETLDFSLEVSNNSPWYLKKIRVYFVQVTTFFAKQSTFNEGARLCKIKCKAVYPKQTANIEGSIQVPQVPPTELGGCRLIHPNYGIMIKVIATTFGKLVKSAVLEGRVPIIIGTVPATAQALTVIRSTMEQIDFNEQNQINIPIVPQSQQSFPPLTPLTSNFVNLCSVTQTNPANVTTNVTSTHEQRTSRRYAE